MEDEQRLVILVNDRARMSRGKYAAQAVHAALLALGVHPEVPVIVLGGSPSEIARMRTTVRDAGRTEVEPGTLTAGTNWGDEDWSPPEELEPENLEKIISVRLPHSLADRLRGYAKAQEESVSDVVRGLISDLLKVEPVPEGLCGEREDHEPHKHDSQSLGTFWCHADQSRRLPFAAEKAREKKVAGDDGTT